MGARAVGALAVLVMSTGCFSPNYADGTLRCGDDGCPDDLLCAADGLCYRTPPPDCEFGNALNCSRCGDECPEASPLCAPAGTDGFECVATCDSRAECGGRCIDTDTSLRHCGQCDHICDVDNASAVCTAGLCAVATCESGFGDCDNSADDGCETPLDTELNCGECRNICGPLQLCSAGECVACPDNAPIVSGTFTATDDPITNFDLRSISGSGAVITVRDSGGASGTLTLTGATIAGSFSGTDDEVTIHNLRAFIGSGDTITVRDGVNASGVLTLTGATVSGAFTATDDGFTRYDLRSIRGNGNQITLRDGAGASGTLTLAGVPTCP